MNETYYTHDLDQIYSKFKTDSNNGLPREEAQNRIQIYGYNEIPKASKGFIKIYLAPLFNWLIVIYLIGALILFLAAIFGNEGNLTFVLLTLAIVALNCIVAIVQQYRATKKLNALREMTAPTTTVIRGGQKLEIPTKEVVVGDLLVLKQGDRIPADGRIIQSSNLEVNESSLTGESEPVKKFNDGRTLTTPDISIGERNNMVFYGTYITTGNGTAITVKTGKDTEIGKISQGLEDAGSSEIPIREKMNNFGKWLGLIVTGFWLIIIFIKWIIPPHNIEIVESLNAALDLLPINIPLLVTIILLTGVVAMAHQGVIIRNLASVDSLGRVSIVCSDKTGTLTKNQMSIQHVWTNGALYKVTGSGYDPEGDIILSEDPKNPEYVRHIEEHQQLKLLLISGFLNNNSALVKNELEISGKLINNWSVIGSPTEGALMVLFQKGMGDHMLDDFEYIREYPFDSKVKRMTKIYKREGKFYSFTKGASEILLPLCNKVIFKNTELDFTDEIREKITAIEQSYANQGYRILCLCYKKLDVIPPEENESGRSICESEMIYIGFVTILDPPREGVKESVKACHDAGVDVVMITGDSPITAKAIAKQISIVTDEDNDLVVEGKDVKNISSFYDFNRIKVFARVSPEHKQDIVERYQDADKVVAMTGDGVNDALALNMADAGIAMGIQGTDVAKEASDMVISDDSFNSIVTGIEEGRGIFSRVRAVVFFYICINVFEGIVQFILAILFDLPYFLSEPFNMQWIFLSITVHMFPGLILTFDSTSKDVMKQKPRDEEEILSKNTFILLFIFGSLLALSMIIVYFITITGIYPVFFENTNFGALNDAYLYSPITQPLYSPGMDLSVAKTLTMLMTTIFFCESFLIYQIRRPNKSLIKSIKEDSTKTMYLLIGLLFGLFLLLMYLPGVQVTLAEWDINFFFMHLTALDWLICFLISLICIASFEVVKYFARRAKIFF